MYIGSGSNALCEYCITFQIEDDFAAPKPVFDRTYY